MLVKEVCACKTTCLYFPSVGEIEYLTNKQGVKRRINSRPYRCLFDNHIIDWNEICPNCTLVVKEVKSDEY